VNWLVGVAVGWQAASINPAITSIPIFLVKVIFTSLCLYLNI
jgi:hypothetical protein